VDYIIVMDEGRISEEGSYQELVARKGDFANFLLEHMTEEVDQEEVGELETIKQELERSMGKQEVSKLLERQASVVSGGTANEEEPPGKVKIGTKLIEKETAETGKVQMEVYFYYMRNLGLAGAIAALVMQVLYQATYLGASFW
jgi:ATP-binding cassette subfamily C (CFTR/MRP) protein 1